MEVTPRSLLPAVLLLSLPLSGQKIEKPLKMGQADSNTFVGLVSDSTCGAKHKMKDKSAEECTRTCVRNGASYVLLAGDKTYALVGHTNEVAYLAGQKTKITGSLEGKAIKVSSVEAAK